MSTLFRDPLVTTKSSLFSNYLTFITVYSFTSFSKPIKDSKDERALTSKRSSKKDSTKHGFFQKIGFGGSSKSASVSPVKNIISAIPRRSSDSRDDASRKIQRKKVEEPKKSNTLDRKPKPLPATAESDDEADDK